MNKDLTSLRLVITSDIGLGPNREKLVQAVSCFDSRVARVDSVKASPQLAMIGLVVRCLPDFIKYRPRPAKYSKKYKGVFVDAMIDGSLLASADVEIFKEVRKSLLTALNDAKRACERNGLVVNMQPMYEALNSIHK